jgi:hypothetical protein
MSNIVETQDQSLPQLEKLEPFMNNWGIEADKI